MLLNKNLTLFYLDLSEKDLLLQLLLQGNLQNSRLVVKMTIKD